MKTIPRFLVAGGLASLVNWLSRFAFSKFLPFAAAVVPAYVLGMFVGFVLYRNWVFERRGSRLQTQIAPFVFVNMLGLTTVELTSTGLVYLLAAWPLLTRSVAEAAAHLIGIAVGAVVNYIGHRGLTFAAR